jgi:hypothetical protein
MIYQEQVRSIISHRFQDEIGSQSKRLLERSSGESGFVPLFVYLTNRWQFYIIDGGGDLESMNLS